MYIPQCKSGSITGTFALKGLDPLHTVAHAGWELGDQHWAAMHVAITEKPKQALEQLHFDTAMYSTQGWEHLLGERDVSTASCRLASYQFPPSAPRISEVTLPSPSEDNVAAATALPTAATETPLGGAATTVLDSIPIELQALPPVFEVSPAPRAPVAAPQCSVPDEGRSSPSKFEFTFEMQTEDWSKRSQKDAVPPPPRYRFNFGAPQAQTLPAVTLSLSENKQDLSANNDPSTSKLKVPTPASEARYTPPSRQLPTRETTPMPPAKDMRPRAAQLAALQAVNSRAMASLHEQWKCMAIRDLISHKTGAWDTPSTSSTSSGEQENIAIASKPALATLYPTWAAADIHPLPYDCVGFHLHPTPSRRQRRPKFDIGMDFACTAYELNFEDDEDGAQNDHITYTPLPLLYPRVPGDMDGGMDARHDLTVH